MLRFAVVPATFSVAVVVVVAARHSAVRSFGEASPFTAVTAHRLFAGVSDPIGLVVGTRPEAWDRHVRVQAPLKIYQTANSAVHKSSSPEPTRSSEARGRGAYSVADTTVCVNWTEAVRIAELPVQQLRTTVSSVVCCKPRSFTTSDLDDPPIECRRQRRRALPPASEAFVTEQANRMMPRTDFVRGHGSRPRGPGLQSVEQY